MTGASARCAIRRATPADAALVAGLFVDFAQEFDDPVGPREVVERRFHRLLGLAEVVVLVAEIPPACDHADDRARRDVAGFAWATLRPSPYDDGPLPVLDELYVRPHLRSRGIGGRLMATLEGTLRANGCAELHVNTDEEDVDAQRFYARWGYRSGEPGTDNRWLLLQKDLG